MTPEMLTTLTEQIAELVQTYSNNPHHYLLYGTMMQILYVLKFLKTSMHLAYTN